MRVVYWLTYLMAAVFLLGETARRGLAYFSINATTMLEDYGCGILLLLAAWFWARNHAKAKTLMAGAWGYATGGMFVPFFAHLEAYLRGATFRSDHPHADVGSIVSKGIIWAVCLMCFIVVLRSDSQTNNEV